MVRYQDISHNKARLRALTSLNPDEFASLVPHVERAFLTHMQDYTIDGLSRRNRRYTAYKNSPLPTIEDKLLFILVHIKQSLTQEVQGELFGMLQSDANKWLQLLRPVLFQALESLDLIPARLASAIAKSESADNEAVSKGSIGGGLWERTIDFELIAVLTGRQIDFDRRRSRTWALEEDMAKAQSASEAMADGGHVLTWVSWMARESESRFMARRARK
jgi:hypothetical protein